MSNQISPFARTEAVSYYIREVKHATETGPPRLC